MDRLGLLFHVKELVRPFEGLRKKRKTVMDVYHLQLGRVRTSSKDDTWVDLSSSPALSVVTLAPVSLSGVRTIELCSHSVQIEA